MKQHELRMNSVEVRKNAIEAYRGLRSEDLHLGWDMGRDEKYDPSQPVARLSRASYERVIVGAIQPIIGIPDEAIDLRLARGLSELDILAKGEGTLRDQFADKAGYHFDWGFVIEDAWIPASCVADKRASAIKWQSERDASEGVAMWHIYQYPLIQYAFEKGLDTDWVYDLAVSTAEYWADIETPPGLPAQVEDGIGDSLFTIVAWIDTPGQEKQVREWLANQMLEGMKSFIPNEMELEIQYALRDKSTSYRKHQVAYGMVAAGERDRKIIAREASRKVTDPLELKRMGVLPRPLQLQGAKALARDILNGVPR
jgi:hypothetical protein